MSKARVLFLCSENSARSQMAEALLRHKAGDKFEVFSAGTNPTSVDERAIAVLKNFGVSAENFQSKSVEQFKDQPFDYVITLCDKAGKECQQSSWFNAERHTKFMAWDFPDPKTRAGSNPFLTTLNELNSRIAMFLLVESKKGSISPSPSPSPSLSISPSPLQFYKCLSDEIRLKSLLLINYFGELCVCELMTALGEFSQPKVSRNLALLKKANLLVDRRHGQWIFYRLNPQLAQWIRTVLVATAEENVDYLYQHIKHIDAMENRPNKKKFCCN
jgi:ArsR family transcriptional regulator